MEDFTMKKIFFLFSFVVCVLLASLQNQIFAENYCKLVNTNNGYYKIYNILQKNDLDYQEVVPYGQHDFEYKSVKLPVVKRTVRGKLDGQNPGGIRMDGYVNFSTNKGTPGSLSINLGHPDFPFAYITYTLGKYTGSSVNGGSIKLPNKNKYYLVYAEKTYEIHSTIVYYRRIGVGGPWKVYYRGSVPILYSEHYYVKEV